MEGKEVPLMRDKKEAEVLYWAGCAGAYDNRGKEISQAVVDVLNEAKPILEEESIIQNS